MGSKIARCLNCSVPKGSSWIYCKYLDDVMAEKFDETGETQACIKYQHDAFDYNEIRIERERQDKKWGALTWKCVHPKGHRNNETAFPEDSCKYFVKEAEEG